MWFLKYRPEFFDFISIFYPAFASLVEFCIITWQMRCGSSCEVYDGKARQTIYCLLIRTMNFSPGFFNYWSPYFLLFWVTKGWLISWRIYRYIVIDNYWCSKTIDKHFDLIDTCCISTFRLHHFINSFIMISKHIKTSQEIVVSLFTHVQISCSESLLLTDWLIRVDFTESAPV